MLIIATYYTIIHVYYTQHASLDKIYIINLDKSPQRYKTMQEKLETVDLPVPYTRFSAIDGRKIKITNKATGETLLGSQILKDKIWLKGDFDAKCQETEDPVDHVLIRNLNQEAYNRRIPGEIGIICSHKKIWQEIVEKGYKNTLVIEDDIRLIPFFDSLLKTFMDNAPQDHELLFLHYRNYGQAFDNKTDNAFSSFFLTAFDTYIKNPFWKRARKSIMSVRGYILTNEGAKKLLQCDHKYAAKKFQTIDATMADCVSDQSIIAYASKPKLIYNDNEAASISNISELGSLKE